MAAVHTGRLALEGLGCRWGACCCLQVEERRRGSHEELAVGHLEAGLASVGVEPKPSGVRWGLEAEGERVPEEVGPDEVVEDREVGHNLQVGGLGEEVQSVADQTDRGREQGEEACLHDSGDLAEEEAVLGQEVEDLGALEGQVGQEEDEEVPESHLE